MSMNINNPSSTNLPYTSFSNAYALPRAGVNKFLTVLNNSTFLDDLRLLFETPLDSVVSLRVFPFDVRRNKLGRPYNTSDPLLSSPAMQTKIKVGGVDIEGVPNVDISDSNANILTWYIEKIPPLHNSFLDYEPYTKIELYLPYIGFISLDPSEVMDRPLTVKYAIDYMTGNATAYVTRPNVFGNEELISTSEGRVAIDIPITSRNAAEVARNILMTGVNSAGGLMSGGGGVGFGIARMAAGDYVGGAMGVAGGLTSLESTAVGVIGSMQVHYTKGSIGDGYNGWYAPQSPHVIITRPIIKEPDNYAHYYGRPSAKTAKLNTLTGFTKVASVHVEGLGTATQDEIAEVERLLMTGVIL